MTLRIGTFNPGDRATDQCNGSKTVTVLSKVSPGSLHVHVQDDFGTRYTVDVECLAAPRHVDLVIDRLVRIVCRTDAGDEVGRWKGRITGSHGLFVTVELEQTGGQTIVVPVDS